MKSFRGYQPSLEAGSSADLILDALPEGSLDDGFMFSLEELISIGIIASISGSSHHEVNGAGPPGFALPWRGDTQEVEMTGYLPVALPLVAKSEDQSYDLGLFGVNRQDAITSLISVAVRRWAATPIALLDPTQHPDLVPPAAEPILYLRHHPGHALHNEGGIGVLFEFRGILGLHGLVHGENLDPLFPQPGRDLHPQAFSSSQAVPVSDHHQVYLSGLRHLDQLCHLRDLVHGLVEPVDAPALASDDQGLGYLIPTSLLDGLPGLLYLRGDRFLIVCGLLRPGDCSPDDTAEAHLNVLRDSTTTPMMSASSKRSFLYPLLAASR